MPQITQEQIDALKAKVQLLIDDKVDADAKTQAANVAVNAAKIADAAAAQANLDEAAADAKTSADVLDLVSFVDALGAPPAPPAA